MPQRRARADRLAAPDRWRAIPSVGRASRRRPSGWNARMRDLDRRARAAADLARSTAAGSITGAALAAMRRRGRGYPFLPVEGEGLHQIPVGPVHAGIIEPGHFRFTANGETVVRLEAAAGLCPQGHRGADGRRRSRAAAKLAGAHLGRQHGRLFLRLRPRRRGRARHRRCRRAPICCAA